MTGWHWNQEAAPVASPELLPYTPVPVFFKEDGPANSFPVHGLSPGPSFHGLPTVEKIPLLQVNHSADISSIAG